MAIRRVLIVLASPISQDDNRANLVNDLCKIFGKSCQTAQLEVDLIDLYNDLDFDPIRNSEASEAKIFQYQNRIKRADLIVFFHPVWWFSLPAILKGFLDKVLVSGFAFRVQNKISQGLLQGKTAIVVALSDRPNWQIKYIYGNSLANFWQKGVLDQCGIKNRFILLGNFRAIGEKEITKWKLKMISLAEKINTKESLLDLI